MLSRMVMRLMLGWFSGPTGNRMLDGKIAISAGTEAKTGMVRGFLLVMGHFKENSPWIKTELRPGRRSAGGSSYCQFKLAAGDVGLEHERNTLVVLCGSESSSGASVRLKILTAWLFGLLAPGVRVKETREGTSSMGSQTWP